MSETKDIIVEGKCGHKFTFSVRDQEFFAQNGWTPPIRCKPCRVQKKAEREAAAANPQEHAREKREHRESSPFHPKNWQGRDRERTPRDAEMFGG